MKLRPTGQCGKYNLLLRNSSGLVTGRDVRLRRSLLVAEAVRGYGHAPEFDYELGEYAPGQYARVTEGGLFDIYIDGTRLDVLSPVYIPMCAITRTPAIPPGPVSINCIATVKEALDGSTTYTWTAEVDAFTYDWQIATDINFTNIVGEIFGTPVTSYTLTTQLTPGFYYWRVRGVSAAGLASDWSVCNVDIVAYIDKVIVDCVDTIAEGDDATFTWSAAGGALTYHIQIASDAGFSTILADVSGISGLSYDYGVITRGRYYWRVRGEVSGTIYGDWSDTCTVSVPFFDILSKTSCSETVEWGFLPLSTVNVRIERKGSINTDTTLISSFRTVSTVPVASSPLTDNILLPGFDYTYHLVAIDGSSNETTPMSDVSAITNPDGAFVPIHNGASMDSGQFNRFTRPDPPFFGQAFNHIRFTVEFRFKRLTSDNGVIWNRYTEEIFGLGNIYEIGQIALNGNFFEITLSRYFVDISDQSFDHVLSTVACAVGEEHHWAFVFDMNETSSPHHTCQIYKDGTLEASLTSDNPNPSTYNPDYVFVPLSYYNNESFLQLMKGTSAFGVLDEFRIWNYCRSATEIDTFKSTVIRENPMMLYRWGFDNYDLELDNSYPPEFSGYGVTAVDPAHDSAYINGGDARVTGTIADASEALLINRNITEPLSVSIPALPVKPILNSPADGGVLDVLNPLFTWTSAGYDHFEFEIASDTGFSTIVHSNTSIKAQSYSPSGLSLDAGATYYWRVRAVSGLNVSAYADYFSFVTSIIITMSPSIPVSDTQTEPYDTQISSSPDVPLSDTKTEPYDTQNSVGPDAPTSTIISV